METRILFLSLLPTIALAGALIAGEDASSRSGGHPEAEPERVGVTVVEPAATVSVIGRVEYRYA